MIKISITTVYRSFATSLGHRVYVIKISKTTVYRSFATSLGHRVDVIKITITTDKMLCNNFLWYIVHLAEGLDFHSLTATRLGVTNDLLLLTIGASVNRMSIC